MKTYNAFTLKMVAIIGMIMQHTAMVLGDVIPAALHFPLHFGGGFTFPIMAFLLVEGYKHTSNVKKYMGRIFVFGLVAQVPYLMAFGGAGLLKLGFAFNIMFTLSAGLLLLVMYDNMKRRGLFWVLFVIITIATFVADWGIIGPIMILLYHVIKQEKQRRIISPVVGGWFNLVFAFIIGIIVIVVMAIADAPALTEMLYAEVDENASILAEMAGLLFPVGTFASILLILGYNGERGRSMKYMFYIVYPLHLLILGVIAYFAGIGTLWLFG